VPRPERQRPDGSFADRHDASTNECGRRFIILIAAIAAIAAPTAAFAGAVSSASVRSTLPLMRLVLRGSQVGPGYRLKFRPDSRGVRNTVTLDMCGFVFRSERLRTARLQVNYVKTGEPVKVSNEVVSYRPGGTALAMREVNTAVAHCPRGPVSSAIAGTGLLTYRVAKFNASGLLPGAIALQVHVTGKVQGHKINGTFISIYQVHADTLSGVYTTTGGSLSARTRIGLHAARESAKNLLQA
jgi:hypothetical protein